MSERGIWSGTVSFGLVAIPVTLTPAVRSSHMPLHMLHSTDHARLERQMVCPKHNAPVHPEHIVRGFEVEPDKYVVVQDSELEALEPEHSRNIEITDFVDFDQIAPMYYDRPYYLAPAGADKPYRLLVEAMKQTHKAGIAKFVLRDRECLTAIRPVEDVLCLFILHFQDDLASSEGIAPAKSHAPAEQVRKIESLMKDMSGRADPRQMNDPLQEKLVKLIQEKRKRVGTVAAPTTGEEEPAGKEPSDLIAALEKSLAKVKARQTGRPRSTGHKARQAKSRPRAGARSSVKSSSRERSGRRK